MAFGFPFLSSHLEFLARLTKFSAKVYPFTFFFGKGKASSSGTLAQEFGIFGLARNSAGWQDKKQSKVFSMSKELKIYNSSQAAGYLRDYMSSLDHEEMWAMFLNNDNRMIEQEMLTKGTLDSTMIDARTIIKHSLLNNASAVIILHNHPSGNPTPSESDIRETEKVHVVGRIRNQRFAARTALNAPCAKSLQERLN